MAVDGTGALSSCRTLDDLKTSLTAMSSAPQQTGLAPESISEVSGG